MDIYDVFEVLEQLGVACDVNGSKVNFFDKENGLEMEIWEDKTKELLIDDLEMYRYYTLYSPKKMVRFQLKHPRIYGELDEKQIVLERTCFSDGHENHVVDLDSGINKAFKIQSYYEDDGIVTGRSEIIVDGSNRIYFDLFGKNGLYNDFFDEEYGLSPSEMREELESNRFIQIFAEYYGKLYPEILDTVELAKSCAKIGLNK